MPFIPVHASTTGASFNNNYYYYPHLLSGGDISYDILYVAGWRDCLVRLKIHYSIVVFLTH